MDVILLEKTLNLGDLGDQVNVKAGYGRNFLIPYGKAVPATKANIEMFEQRRAELEKAAAEKLGAAQSRGEKLNGTTVTIPARAGDEGKLFGSVGTQEIAEALEQATGTEVEKAEVMMPHGVIRQTGEYPVDLVLHSDVDCSVTVVVVAED